MISIGITGQAGFIGSHLSNFLRLKKDEVSLIPFQDDFFSDETQLKFFVKQCDAIVHLAAINRHNDPEVIYKTNIDLVNKLIQACVQTSSTPHILFSSSTVASDGIAPLNEGSTWLHAYSALPDRSRF